MTDPEYADVDEAGQLAIGVPGEQRAIDGLAVTPERGYRCASCGRKLTNERWVYSRHTGARYCLPGEGCERA